MYLYLFWVHFLGMLAYFKRLMIVPVTLDGKNALCFDVNIQNVNRVHSSVRVSSRTNRTANLFSVHASINLWDIPLPCCGFVYFITMVRWLPATVLHFCHFLKLSLFTPYQWSLRCNTKLFSFLLITLHFCLHHSCMKLAISLFSGTDRGVIP